MGDATLWWGLSKLANSNHHSLLSQASCAWQTYPQKRHKIHDAKTLKGLAWKQGEVWNEEDSHQTGLLSYQTAAMSGSGALCLHATAGTCLC